MNQRERERSSHGDGEDEIEITVNNHAAGHKVTRNVKNGLRFKDVLAIMRHEARQGLIFKWNNRQIEWDEATQDFVENPLLQHHDVIDILSTFRGGMAV